MTPVSKWEWKPDSDDEKDFLLFVVLSCLVSIGLMVAIWLSVLGY